MIRQRAFVAALRKKAASPQSSINQSKFNAKISIRKPQSCGSMIDNNCIAMQR